MNMTERAVAFARQLLHLYFDEKDFARLRNLFDEKLSWIGANQLCENYVQAIELLNRQQSYFMSRFHILNEQYHTTLLSEECACVYGELLLSDTNDMQHPKPLRFTLLCKENEDAVHLLHAHFSLPNVEMLRKQASERALGRTTLEQCLQQRTEELLHKNIQLETLAANVPGGVFNTLLDERYTMTYVNDGYLRLTGYSREELQERFQDQSLLLVHEKDRQQVKQEIECQLQKSDFIELQHWICKKSGEPIWVSMRGRRVYDRTGIPTLYCVLIDNSAAKRAEQALQRKSRDVQMLTETIPGGVKRCLNDEFFTICYISDGFLQMFGYSREEIHTLFEDRYFNMIYEADRELVCSQLKEQLATGDTIELIYRGVCKDGRIIWLLNKGRLVRDEEGEEFFHCVLVDISENRTAQEALKVSEELYRLVSERSNDIVFEYNLQKKSIYYSRSFEQRFGYSPCTENFPESALRSGHIHPQDIPVFQTLAQSLFAGQPYLEEELRIQSSNGQFVWCHVQVSMVFDDRHQPLRIVGRMMDIDDQKREREHLIDKAQKDTLTNLYNKGTTQALIEAYLEREGKQGRHALIIIDVDNFKGINDHLGHLFGDAVLSEISSHIQGLFRSTDIIGRIGGDEFLVFLKDMRSFSLLDEKSRDLMNLFRKTFSDHQKDYRISGSVGISLYPEHGETYTELFKKADIALYSAKHRGKDRFAIFDDMAVQQSYLNACPGGSCSVLSGYEIIPEAQKSFEENITEYLFKILYDTPDIDTAVNLILDLTGRHFNVSRAYVFENNEDDTACSNTFEWCNEGITPQKEYLQNLSYSELPGFQELFHNEDGVFYCHDIHTLPTPLFEILDQQDVISVLQVAILDNGKFRGYVGFDECVKSLYPTPNAVETLKLISHILSIFLLKRRAQDRLVKSHQILHSVLDNIDLWTYVIDMSNHRLLYINRKTELLAPDSRIGDLCYEAFHARSTPCERCPMRYLLEGEARHSMKIYNQVFKVWTEATACRIHWIDGKEVCLMSCIDITQLYQPEAFSATQVNPEPTASEPAGSETY